jgi:hypothetical protein
MYADEYSARNDIFNGVILVCGWFGRKVMKNIIFSNNVSLIYILMNQIENKWKKSHLSAWNSSINSAGRQFFEKDVLGLYDNKENIEVEISENVEELSEDSKDIDTIENSIRNSKFAKYINPEKSEQEENIIEAVPISFIGGYFAFYKNSANIITATEIINSIVENSKQRINIKKPEEIEKGDYVLIRETERSLIHELADDILKKDNKDDYREIANRWKKGLNEKINFGCTIRKLHEMVIEQGAKIGLQTFRNWLNDDDFIAPQDNENLLYISVALNDNYLINNIDKINDVCREVRSAHVRAGMLLSKRLKTGIAKVISEMSEDERRNVWNPIDLILEGVGNVKVLKVIEINSPIKVSGIYTNRLLRDSTKQKLINILFGSNPAKGMSITIKEAVERTGYEWSIKTILSRLEKKGYGILCDAYTRILTLDKFPEIISK